MVVVCVCGGGLCQREHQLRHKGTFQRLKSSPGIAAEGPKFSLKHFTIDISNYKKRCFNYSEIRIRDNYVELDTI